MKKHNLLISFIILIMVLICKPEVTYAFGQDTEGYCTDSKEWACAVCKYTNESFKEPLTFYIKSDGTNVDFTYTEALNSDQRTYWVQMAGSMSLSVFANNNNDNISLVNCPATLYGIDNNTYGAWKQIIINPNSGEYKFKTSDSYFNQKRFYSDDKKHAQTKVDKDCEGVLGTDLIEFFQKILNWVKIVAPILVIVLGSIDFAGALLKDDKDALSKAFGKLMKRIIIAIVLFFIPVILNFILDIYNGISSDSINTCV